MTDRRRTRPWLRIASLVGLAVTASYSCGSDPVAPTSDGGLPTDGTEDVSSPDDGVDAPTVDANATECERSAADHSVAGCEYLVFDAHGLYDFACTGVVLSNLSLSDASIELEFRGNKLDATQFMRLIVGSGKNVTYAPLSVAVIPPGRSAVVSAFQGKVEHMGTGEECPSAAAGGAAMAPADALGYGLWIRSSVPVGAFYDYPYGAPSSNAEGATALRSTGTYGTRYRDVGIYKPGRPDVQFGGIGTLPGWTAITGLTTTTVGLASDAGPRSVVLTQGRVFTAMQDDGFIGSLITGTQPFGAWARAVTPIPFDWPNADFTPLQFAATSDWGWEYAAVRYPSRYAPTDKTSIWRLIGDSPGTVLTYDPAIPPGAPTTLGAGALAIFRTGDPFVVRSQDPNHRFYLVQLMTGWTDSLGVQDAEAPEDGGWLGSGFPPGAYGDPEAEATPPLHEYGTRYVFFTQPTYPTTQLVFIRHKAANGFQDVTLDCAGTLTGWKTIGQSDYQYVYVALSDGNYLPQVYPGGTCDNGNHVAESAGPFSIAVWAWPTVADQGEFYPFATSYGYVVPGRTRSARTSQDGGPLPN